MLFGLLGNKNAYKPQWVSFNRTVDTKPYSFKVDTGRHTLLEQKEYRNVLVVSFVSQHPDEQGMPSAEEQTLVATGSKKILEIVQSLTETFFLGTVVGNGTLLLYYVCVKPVEDKAFAEVLGTIPLAHTLTWADDSGWSFIKGTIYPTDKELQRLTNDTVLEIVKVEQGKDNDLPAPHGMVHTIFLKSSESGTRIAEDLKGGGYYQFGRIAPIKNPGKSAYLYIMELGKDETLTPESVNQQTDTVIDAIQKYEAKYDGWRAIQGGAS
jgi:hypothetical protein